MVYRKVHILCLLLFLSNLIYGKGNDSILQNKNGYYSLKYYHNNIKGEMPFKKFQAIWLYSDNDRYKNCRPELKDDNWIPVYSNLNENDSNKIEFKGLAWFRLHVFVDTVFTSGVSLEFFNNGAWEVFVNGNYYGNLGIVSSVPENELAVAPTNKSIQLPPLKIGEWYHIAVRFSNTEYKNSYNGLGVLEPGYKMSIEGTDRLIKDLPNNIYPSAILGSGLFAFFFTLSFIHFLLYIFYKAKRSNLYYSLLSFTLGFIFLQILLGSAMNSADTKRVMGLITLLITPIFFYLLIIVLNSLFEYKQNIFSKILGVLTLLCVASVMINNLIFLVLLAANIISTLVYALVILFFALKNKKPGSKLIGSGFGFFALFILSFFVLSIFFGGNLKFDHVKIGSLVLIILLCLCIISIPFTMSIFLAWDFSKTNKSLSKKLIEVEELSKRSIEQEKEKQKLLSEQNENLELQVTERTKEIHEQKKLIEEKNKDITDSINYAQRIQRSILPTQNEIKDIFENAFVLFKPRDIVSGDFYQFKKVGDLKFCILADCTGHGVPGALMSMIGSNLIHQVIIERGINEPNKILSELHKEVKSTLRQTSGDQSHDGMDASVVLLQGKKIFIASANRPVYIVQDNVLTEVKPDKRSIGGSQSLDEVEFVVTELDVQSNMMIYLFSDGYADQFGGEAGKKFKVKNLNGLLLSINEKPLDVQHEILNSTFDTWKNHLEQVDDVSLIGIRF